MRLLETLYSHFGKKRKLRTFWLLQKPPAWAWKKQCPFFISSEGCWKFTNSSGSLFSKNVYKLPTKTVESWKPGPNFLGRPPFLDEYVVLKECYLVGVECQIQDIITSCPKKAHAQLFWESWKCCNVYSKSLQICKHVDKSTNL